MIEPGAPGFSEAGFTKFLLGWGRSFIYRTGQIGLQLFNALRARFAGADTSSLGRWSRWLGASAKMGVELTALGNSDSVPIDRFPLAGGTAFDEDPSAQWRIDVLVEGRGVTSGKTRYRSIPIYGSGPMTGLDLDERVWSAVEDKNRAYESGNPDSEAIEPLSFQYLTALAQY